MPYSLDGMCDRFVCGKVLCQIFVYELFSEREYNINEIIIIIHGYTDRNVQVRLSCL